MSYAWQRNAFSQKASEDILTPVFELELPRGKAEVQLRLSPYPNGSLALEMRDGEGRPFYWPTLPCCPTTLAGLVPEEAASDAVVAVKPSSLRNGMAQALIDAGLLTDLGLEMPVDRHWVRLMRVEFAAAEQLAGRIPSTPPRPVPHRLLPMPVPPGWADTVRRIQQVFLRHGKAVDAEEAMLAWALQTRAIAPLPKPLPPSAGAIHELLAPLFERADDSAT